MRQLMKCLLLTDTHDQCSLSMAFVGLVFRSNCRPLAKLQRSAESVFWLRLCSSAERRKSCPTKRIAGLDRMQALVPMWGPFQCAVKISTEHLQTDVLRNVFCLFFCVFFMTHHGHPQRSSCCLTWSAERLVLVVSQGHMYVNKEAQGRALDRVPASLRLWRLLGTVAISANLYFMAHSQISYQTPHDGVCAGQLGNAETAVALEARYSLPADR